MIVYASDYILVSRFSLGGATLDALKESEMVQIQAPNGYCIQMSLRAFEAMCLAVLQKKAHEAQS